MLRSSPSVNKTQENLRKLRLSEIFCCNSSNFEKRKSRNRVAFDHNILWSAKKSRTSQRLKFRLLSPLEVKNSATFFRRICNFLSKKHVTSQRKKQPPNDFGRLFVFLLLFDGKDDDIIFDALLRVDHRRSCPFQNQGLFACSRSGPVMMPVTSSDMGTSDSSAAIRTGMRRASRVRFCLPYPYGFP